VPSLPARLLRKAGVRLIKYGRRCPQASSM
jgi:hypothetical protein